MFSHDTNQHSIRLVCDRHNSKCRILPWVFIIVYGSIMVVAGLIASYLTFSHNQYWALLFFLPTAALAGFLAFIVYSMVRESYCDYIVEITDHDAAFSRIDHLKNKKTTKFVLLADIKYAEYYPYLDSASIIFHTPYANIEVPLWQLGKHAATVIDFLSGAGVKIIDVQSDEPIPD